MTSLITKVDSKPIYLGYQTDQRKYCFYAIKQGVPRFLSYIQYFFWDRGPQEALTLKEIPIDIEQELINFLKGNIEYEFFKQRKNSREESVRKVFRLPEFLESSDPVPYTIPGREDVRCSRTRGSVRSSVGSTISEPAHVETPGTVQRRPRQLRHASVETCPTDTVLTPVVVVAPPVVETPKVKLKRKPREKVVDVQIDEPIQETPVSSKVSAKMLKALEKLSKSEEIKEPIKMNVLEPKIKVSSEALVVKRGKTKVTTLEKPEEVAPKGNGNSKRQLPDVNVPILKTKKPKPS